MEREQQRLISEKPSLAEPISGLMTPRASIGLRGRQNLSTRSVPYTETTEAVFIYSIAIVMQCEREDFHVGALPNMAALIDERVVIFVIRTFSVPVA